MKKIVLVFMWPLCLFSQNLKVVDLVGDWYGNTSFVPCNNLLCTLSYIEYPHYNYHLQISVKDSTLEIADLTGTDDNGSFYGGIKPLNEIQSYKIKNGEIEPGPWSLHKATLGYSLLDRGSISFVRSKKNYNNLLLSMHSWVNNGCTVFEQGVICLQSPNIGVDQFSLKGDTLVFDRRLSYLYDDTAQLYRLVQDSSHTLTVVNDSLLLFKVNGMENQLQRAKLSFIEENEAYTGFGGRWVSKARDKYIEIYAGKIETNLADDYQQIYGADKKKGEMRSYLIPQDRKISFRRLYLENYSEILKTNFLYFTIQDADSINPLGSEPVFRQTEIIYRFRIGTASITNMVTEEEFSIVSNIETNTIESHIALKSNPVTDEAEINGLDQFDYELLNAQGIMVKSGLSTDGKISTTSLLPGGYFIKVSAQGKSSVFKLIKSW